MPTMLMNSGVNSQNTGALAVWLVTYGLVASRQYGCIPAGASATLNAHSSLGANWWMA